MNGRVVPSITETMFFDLAGVELKRAERYRIFVSLAVLDLSFLQGVFGPQTDRIVGDLAAMTARSVRASDTATLLEHHRIALLFPETSRQNAGIAARRMSDLIRLHLKEKEGLATEELISVEMASYPDAGGAKSLTTFLEELAVSRRN